MHEIPSRLLAYARTSLHAGGLVDVVNRDMRGLALLSFSTSADSSADNTRIHAYEEEHSCIHAYEEHSCIHGYTHICMNAGMVYGCLVVCENEREIARECVSGVCTTYVCMDVY